MTTKQEVFKRIQEKSTLSNEELNKIYSDVETELRKHTKPTEVDILNTILSYLTPSLRTSAEKHYGIFLGFDDNFGFNKKVDSVKFDSMNQYQENPELAISNNLVKLTEKKEVIPIWHYLDGISIKDWQFGKPITNLDYSATAYILYEKEDKKYELKKMKLTGDRRDSIFKEVQNIQGKRVSFMAINKEDGTFNDSKYTKFIIEEEQPKENLPQILNKYVKNFKAGGGCLALSEVSSFFDKNIEKTFKGLVDIPVFIRVTPLEPIISEIRDSNIIPTIDSGYEKQFTCFLPKYLGLPKPNVSGTIFGGRIRKKEDEKNEGRPFSLNAFMFWQDIALKDLQMPESLTKHSLKEIKGNVQQSLEMLEKTGEEEW